MAMFTTNSAHPVNFGSFDIADLVGDFLYLASATTWRTGPFFLDSGTRVEFEGVGFTYSGGALTGGTINSIASYTSGSFDFQIAGLSLSAATFNAYRTADDSMGFLGAVFNGNDTVSGSNLSDLLMGFAGADTLDGKDGNDILDGGAGADTLIGGKGDDTYVVDSALDVIMESGGSTGDWVRATISIDLTKVAYLGIEHAYLTGDANLSAAGDNTSNQLVGNDGANKLSGDLGNDMLSGGAGADTLDGGGGSDEMMGGAGNDTYYVDSAGDTVSESVLVFGDTGGLDTVFSSIKSFTLPDYVEKLTLTGAAVQGYGNDLDNTLTGNANANYLDGKAGADTMIGGNGDDWYLVDSAKDKVTETSTGGTADTVFSTASFTLGSYVEDLVLLASAANGKGNGSDNRIYGNGAANFIEGAAGNDDLFGGAGADTLIGGAGNDDVHGAAGDDTIDTSQGNDRVFYDSTADGFDVILGFDGNATGGQDKLNLNDFFEDLGVGIDDRAGRVGVADNGAVVDVWIDTDGDDYLDMKIAEIHTVDVIKVGEDIDVAYQS